MSVATIRLLTLNLFKGRYLDEVIAFLQKNSFDVIHMQEVSSGLVSCDQRNCFDEIKRASSLHGEVIASWHLRGDPSSYFGNATFFRPHLVAQAKREFRFQPLQEVEEPENMFKLPSYSRSALFVQIGGIWFVNTHLAWGPTPYDEPYKVEDAKKLAQELKALADPFVLTGDFNVVSSTEVIAHLASVARNLTQENNVENTLNRACHRAQHLFPPGLAVDYIMPHPSLRVEQFQVIAQPTLSDHLGLSVCIG